MDTIPTLWRGTAFSCRLELSRGICSSGIQVLWISSLEPFSKIVNEFCGSREQEILKSRLILHDDFSWTLPPKTSDTTDGSIAGSSQVEEGNWLRYVGGVDLSFSKSDSSTALGALVVLDIHSMNVVYEDFDMVQLEMPYIPGFLAFREVSSLPTLSFLCHD